jgi:hypothetical protein
MVAPPSVPEGRLDGWRLTDDREDVPFAAPGLTVTARVLVYEDAALRETIRDRVGMDRNWRFYLAGRLELAPSPPGSGALRRLVASRASAGFADRLAERGFGSVEAVERRPFRVGDVDARLVRYRATCPVEDVTLPVEAWLAVWAPDRTFRLSGGAYPTGVRGNDDGGLRDLLDPDAFRDDLFALIRDTG